MKQTSLYTTTARFKVLEDLNRNSVDLCLSYCGYEHCEPGHRFGPNRRISYVLHIVKSGKGRLEIDGKSYVLGAGDAFLIPPEVEAWYEADREDPWVYMWVGFTGYKAQSCTESAGFSLKAPVRSIGIIDTLAAYIEQILEAYQLSYVDELKRSAYLMLFFAELAEDFKAQAPSAAGSYRYPGSVYVQHAIDYIELHYAERIKINELAAYIGVNRSYLTNCFKRNVGCSPQEYLVDLRLEKARTMLKGSTQQIQSIAAAVGYSDQLAFSKMFRQRHGISPKEYRDTPEKLIMCFTKSDRNALPDARI